MTIPETKRFIVAQPDLCFVQADKSNKIIIMTREMYNKDIYNIVNDNTAYVQLTK